MNLSEIEAPQNPIVCDHLLSNHSRGTPHSLQKLGRQNHHNAPGNVLMSAMNAPYR